jgi:hypothetical protein
MKIKAHGQCVFLGGIVSLFAINLAARSGLWRLAPY